MLGRFFSWLFGTAKTKPPLALSFRGVSLDTFTVTVDWKTPEDTEEKINLARSMAVLVYYLESGKLRDQIQQAIGVAGYLKGDEKLSTQMLNNLNAIASLQRGLREADDEDDDEDLDDFDLEDFGGDDDDDGGNPGPDYRPLVPADEVFSPRRAKLTMSEYILSDYDRILVEIMERGEITENRTGVKTRTLFGVQCRYDLRERFPLLTRRKVWPKAIWAELLWILSGSTNVKDLQALGSRIWDEWYNEDFCKKHLYVQGSLGPVYGFQLRHFGGFYGYGNWEDRSFGRDGVDQLAEVIRLLKEDPTSRRILFSLWNPRDVPVSRLPPCHLLFQLHVHDGRLSGMMTQRSADWPIGVPANIQFYSTLILMLAQHVGLQPGELVHSVGNAHIYENQIAGIEEYLSRPLVPSPTLKIQSRHDILAHQIEDFLLEGYTPLEPIKIPVEV